MSIFNFNSFCLKSQSSSILKKGFLLLESVFALLFVSSLACIFGLWFINITNDRVLYINRVKALNYSSNILEHIKSYKNTNSQLLNDNLANIKKEGFDAKINLQKDPSISNLFMVTVSIVLPDKKSKITLSTQVLM